MSQISLEFRSQAFKQLKRLPEGEIVRIFKKIQLLRTDPLPGNARNRSWKIEDRRSGRIKIPLFPEPVWNTGVFLLVHVVPSPNSELPSPGCLGTPISEAVYDLRAV